MKGAAKEFVALAIRGTATIVGGFAAVGFVISIIVYIYALTLPPEGYRYLVGRFWIPLASAAFAGLVVSAFMIVGFSIWYFYFKRKS